MPLYDYRCRACGQVSEVRHGFGEGYHGTCAACGASDLARVFNPAGIVFKGSGFYVNDSRKAAGAAEGAANGAAPKPAADGSAAPAPAAGPAAAPAAKPAESAPKKSEPNAA